MATSRSVVFMIGNKRSGTSMLVRLLNRHPRVYVTHESDVGWILYQSRNGRPDTFRCYPWDGPLGMRATLDAADGVVATLPADRPPTDAELTAAFHEIQDTVMKRGSAVQRALPWKRNLAWIGDKKPVQGADPEIRPFVERVFPDVRYLHIVRHPGPVLASSERMVREWDVVPAFWRDGADAILERWRIHEQWVLDARAAGRPPIHTVRYEDLLVDPVGHMERCCAFLDLPMSPLLRWRIRRLVQPANIDKTVAIEPGPRSAGIEDIMRRYGYGTDGSVGAYREG